MLQPRKRRGCATAVEGRRNPAQIARKHASCARAKATQKGSALARPLLRRLFGIMINPLAIFSK